GKKTGNAVKRNRSRRIIREAFRQATPQIREGFDFILVARGRTPFVKSTDIYRVLMRQLKDAGVLK
ncbi:MAG: ribonuclease P protein component, partial [Clostridiales bacterium]|nr:ribonuclease P protein component [Clostridiales bacterium]